MFSNGQKDFHRGDIYFCEFISHGGSVQSGLRPALIIQNNVGNKYSPTLIVSPITSIVKKKKQPTHVYLDKNFGLNEESMVMLEQISTVDKNIHMKEYIGSINDNSVIEKINKALKISLGIK
ncbi:MAG: type II toxin-antitoxin system PemK/MazF family toxin [Faecalibacterium sp.]|nr:type II toxin-antitoxin system PemK/MazF family toxin [Ruminococcus sp.]MCM1484617.1 type II toxin-antitoxin system PemK/MazF family toxin [Faecalibacterium sp.]